VPVQTAPLPARSRRFRLPRTGKKGKKGERKGERGDFYATYQLAIDQDLTSTSPDKDEPRGKRKRGERGRRPTRPVLSLQLPWAGLTRHLLPVPMLKEEKRKRKEGRRGGKIGAPTTSRLCAQRRFYHASQYRAASATGLGTGQRGKRKEKKKKKTRPSPPPVTPCAASIALDLYVAATEFPADCQFHLRGLATGGKKKRKEREGGEREGPPPRTTGPA